MRSGALIGVATCSKRKGVPVLLPFVLIGIDDCLTVSRILQIRGSRVVEGLISAGRYKRARHIFPYRNLQTVTSFGCGSGT